MLKTALKTLGYRDQLNDDHIAWFVILDFEYRGQ
jgi:hypothetical protein